MTKERRNIYICSALLGVCLYAMIWYSVGHRNGKVEGYDIGVHASNVKCGQRLKAQRKRYQRSAKRARSKVRRNRRQAPVTPEAQILNHILQKL